MSRALAILVNIMLFSTLVVIIDGLGFIAGSEVFGLLVGGGIFALGAIAVEPILGFFKFPSNFWGLLLVGFIINLTIFVFFSSNILPGVVSIGPGVFGAGFSPIPFFRLELNSSIIVVIVTSSLATLLQILIKRLSKQ